jgi:hypothetical protein
MRKLICIGILAPLAVLCFMNAACGGYQGWPGRSTEGSDAKLSGNELSVSGGTGPFALENGLWTFYVNYDNTKGPGMKEVSTYRDATAPFAVFTSDGNAQQYFNDHVGVKVAAAVDTNGNGIIDFLDNDYAINDAFCPVLGFGSSGDPDKSDGFAAYCDKGLWEVIVSSNFTSESKQTAPGSKFSNSHGGGSDFSPVVLAGILASGTPTADGGVQVNATGLSVGGNSYTLAAPAGATIYGFKAVALDISQPSMKDGAAWLAGQLVSASGPVNVGVQLNGVVVNFRIAGGPVAAAALRAYAGS